LRDEVISLLPAQLQKCCHSFQNHHSLLVLYSHHLRHFASSPDEQLRFVLKDFLTDGNNFKKLQAPSEQDNVYLLSLDFMLLCEASPELASVCHKDFGRFEQLMQRVITDEWPDVRINVRVKLENFVVEPVPISVARGPEFRTEVVLVHAKISGVGEEKEALHSSVFVCANSKCQEYGEEQDIV